MKKLILFSFAMSMMLGSWAQITVTRNDMPNAGDSVLVSLTNTIGSLDATLTGANYAWDFSSLTYTSQQEIKFDNPFNFPTIYAILFNILNTSYGRENRNLTAGRFRTKQNSTNILAKSVQTRSISPFPTHTA